MQKKHEAKASHATPDVPAIPASATSTWINLVGLGCFLVTLYLLNGNRQITQLHAALLAMAAYAVPIVVLELIFLKTWRRASTGYNFSAPQPFAPGRIIVKLLGFYFSMALVGVVYAVFPEYNGGFYGYLINPSEYGGHYGRYWEFVKLIVPILALMAIPYFAIMERYASKHRDGNWQAGMLLLGRWHEIDGKRLGQHCLGWLVKGFFLPLMTMWTMDKMHFFIDLKYPILLNNFAIVGQYIAGFGHALAPQQVVESFNDIFRFMNEVIFAVDLAVVTIGYVLTIRLFDSHLRSAEPTLAGWFWAVLCYPPFWVLISPLYFAYENDGINWQTLFSAYPGLLVFWGLAIIALEAIYSAASVQFGVRFSNLTHRGVLTNGVYRWTKHPAYVSKNLSWWLISVPFVTSPDAPAWFAVQACLLLAANNFVYYMRARTEERHLSSDPVYVQYALAMNERGMFAWLGKLLPFLRYKEQPKLVELA